MEQEFATFRYKNGRVYRTDAHTLAVMQDVKAWDAQAAEGIFDRGLQTGRIAESFDRVIDQAKEFDPNRLNRPAPSTRIAEV